MSKENEKMKKSIYILKSLVKGINPYTKEDITDDYLLTDERLKKCFSYVSSVLEKDLTKVTNGEGQNFYISKEELNKVELLKDESIGISKFCGLVNNSIDLGDRKKLSAIMLNGKLCEVGLLAKQKYEGSKSYSTVALEKARKYGIHMIEVNYEGKVYNKVVYNYDGQRFLLKNLNKILSYDKNNKSNK